MCQIVPPHIITSTLKYMFVMTISGSSGKYFTIDNKRILLITIKQIITRERSEPIPCLQSYTADRELQSYAANRQLCTFRQRSNFGNIQLSFYRIHRKDVIQTYQNIRYFKSEIVFLSIKINLQVYIFFLPQTTSKVLRFYKF